jgi:hypothetical protein
MKSPGSYQQKIGAALGDPKLQLAIYSATARLAERRKDRTRTCGSTRTTSRNTRSIIWTITSNNSSGTSKLAAER